MALIAAAAAVVCQRLALRATGDAGASLAAWLAAAGAPLFFYSFHLYTEAPSALAASGSLAILLGTPGWPGAVGAALAASALPWLHVKMIPAAVALGVIAGARLRGRPLAAFLLAAGAMALGFALYYRAIFGVASPLALYGGVPADARTLSWRSLGGLLLDRSYGLLPIAPVFLIALAGVPALLQKRDAWPHLLLGLAVIAPLVSWRMWWGGQCPPARFLVPLLPLLAVALAWRRVEPPAASRAGSRRSWRREPSSPGLRSRTQPLASCSIAATARPACGPRSRTGRRSATTCHR
jgi:hypothetical protein